jgi:hypothetical protein
MSKQDELDAIFRRIAAEHGKLNEKQVTFVIREIGRIRAELADLLADFADADGTIKRQRLMRLLRELETIEAAMRRYGEESLNSVIEESATFAVDKANDAMKSVPGVPLVGAGVAAINRNVVEYVATRFGDDGLVLSDRIWTTAGEIRDAIAAQLRADIIKGEAVSTMIRNIRRIYENETWIIRRLVVTEANTAYRTANAMSIERSEVADWVRIVENGSRHQRHQRHRCYELAREDRYGRGQGVFKPTDSEIYCPHPNCSSYIVPVLKDEYL